MTAAPEVESDQLNLRDWQREALDKWWSADRRGVVEAVTGTGKTTLGIAASAWAVRQGLSVLVVVPGIDLLDQWFRAFQKNLPKTRAGRRGGGYSETFETCDVLITTVQSAIQKKAPIPPGRALMVADEVHRYGALTFSQLLQPIYSERLGLTATFERTDDGVEQHLLPYFGSVIQGCDYERGHQDGILAPVRVMLVAVPLSEVEQSKYSELDETAQREQRALIGKYGCTPEPFGEFMREVQQLSEGEAGRATWAARNYLRAFSQRRALLAEAESKLDTVRNLGAVLSRSGRSILFSETKESSRAAAEVLLEEGVLAAPYTSDLSRTDRSILLAAFRNGAMKALVAPKVLDEGVDVPEADVGIILAGSKSRRQMIQRMGRIIRPKTDGRHASFLVLFAKGTSEDPENGAHGTFLEQLTGIASTIITVDSAVAPGILQGWLGGSRAEENSVDAQCSAQYRETANRLSSKSDCSELDYDLGESHSYELRAVLHDVARTPSAEKLDAVLTSLSVLTPDAVSVMILRYGLGGHRPMSRVEVAAALGIATEAAAAVEAEAMVRLGEKDAAETLAALL